MAYSQVIAHDFSKSEKKLKKAQYDTSDAQAQRKSAAKSNRDWINSRGDGLIAAGASRDTVLNLENTALGIQRQNTSNSIKEAHESAKRNSEREHNAGVARDEKLWGFVQEATGTVIDLYSQVEASRAKAELKDLNYSLLRHGISTQELAVLNSIKGDLNSEEAQTNAVVQKLLNDNVPGTVIQGIIGSRPGNIAIATQHLAKNEIVNSHNTWMQDDTIHPATGKTYKQAFETGTNAEFQAQQKFKQAEMFETFEELGMTNMHAVLGSFSNAAVAPYSSVSKRNELAAKEQLKHDQIITVQESLGEGRSISGTFQEQIKNLRGHERFNGIESAFDAFETLADSGHPAFSVTDVEEFGNKKIPGLGGDWTYRTRFPEQFTALRAAARRFERGEQTQYSLDKQQQKQELEVLIGKVGDGTITLNTDELRKIQQAWRAQGHDGLANQLGDAHSFQNPTNTAGKTLAGSYAGTGYETNAQIIAAFNGNGPGAAKAFDDRNKRRRDPNGVFQADQKSIKNTVALNLGYSVDSAIKDPTVPLATQYFQKILEDRVAEHLVGAPGATAKARMTYARAEARKDVEAMIKAEPLGDVSKGQQPGYLRFQNDVDNLKASQAPTSANINDALNAAGGDISDPNFNKGGVFLSKQKMKDFNTAMQNGRAPEAGTLVVLSRMAGASGIPTLKVAEELSKKMGLELPAPREISAVERQFIDAGLGLNTAKSISDGTQARRGQNTTSGVRHSLGHITYESNPGLYQTFGRRIQKMGFKVAEHDDFGGTSNVHKRGAYHQKPDGSSQNEGMDITHPTGDYNTSIEYTRRFKEAMRKLGALNQVVGPGDGDPGHETHTDLGGIRFMPTEQQWKWVENYVFGGNQQQQTSTEPSVVPVPSDNVLAQQFQDYQEGRGERPEGLPEREVIQPEQPMSLGDMGLGIADFLTGNAFNLLPDEQDGDGVPEPLKDFKPEFMTKNGILVGVLNGQKVKVQPNTTTPVPISDRMHEAMLEDRDETKPYNAQASLSGGNT